MIQQMYHNNTVGHAHDKHHVNQSNNVLFLWKTQQNIARIFTSYCHHTLSI